MNSKQHGNNCLNDDKVGYGNPPKKNRFQKGKSGNPKGRPRKTNGLKELLDKELQRNVIIKGKNIQVQQLMIRSLINNVTKGNSTAQKIVFEHLAGYDTKPDEQNFIPEVDDMIALKQWMSEVEKFQQNNENV